MPCHNVEKYLDDFFHSVFSQSVDPECLEIIAVDDGSTDGTAQRIADWAERFPGRIQYIFQPNQRQAAARNTGLALATGEWVSFPDPDDCLARNYIEQVIIEIARERENLPLSMVACNMIFFRDGRNIDDSHPLRYRFKHARTVLPASDPQDFMQLAVNCVWFRRDLIERHDLNFDTRVLPTFEDGHFVNRFLLLNWGTEIVFLKEPVYYYRKRVDADSTVDLSKYSKSWYLDQLRYGYLDLLAQAKSTVGHVPRFIERTVLYDVFWRFRHLVDHPERASFLSEKDREEFFELLRLIFCNIGIHTINSFDLAHCTEEHKVGLLGLMMNAGRPVTTVYARQYDPAKGLMQFSYFSFDPQNTATVRVDDRTAPLWFVSSRTARFLDHTYFVEHFFWVQLQSDEYVRVYVDGKTCPLKFGSATLGEITTLAKISPVLRQPKSLPQKIRTLRRVATSSEATNNYGDCWLLMDRDDKADDNAEHLYRYLRGTDKADKAFFVLRPESPDWTRLEADGFRLIPFNSREHHVALINAAFLISSHLQGFILWPVPRRQIQDLTKYRFVFLQHGVTKHDVSRWVNTKNIDLFITTTHDEYSSIVNSGSGYKFSSKEVALTGLPRHDRLSALNRTTKTILIMPTWRLHLTGQFLGVGMERDRSPLFARSEYAARWGSLLRSPRLRALSQRHGLNLVFCPHPNVTPHLSDLDVPDYVQVRSPLAIESLQPLFAETAVLITDYSSVAFDVAYLEKPVLYYHFDAGEIFAGEHTYQRGYFDYATHGFGPVSESEDDLFTQLEATLAGKEAPQYAARRRDTFPFRDGKCCERVYQSILALNTPRHDGIQFIEGPAAGDTASLSRSATDKIETRDGFDSALG